MLWRMPLGELEEYFEGASSNIADFNNIGLGGSAGSIFAALFCKVK